MRACACGRELCIVETVHLNEPTPTFQHRASVPFFGAWMVLMMCDNGREKDKRNL